MDVPPNSNVRAQVAKFTWYWSEKQHNAWQQKRAKGATRFVLADGLAAWGGPMFFIMGAGPALLGIPYKANPTPSYWLLQLVLWSVAGLLYGIAAWHFCERVFSKHAEVAP